MIRLCTRCNINPRRTQQSANATWCISCTRIYAKAKRLANIAAGLCSRCSEPNTSACTQCPSCRAKRGVDRNAKRLVLKKQCVAYLGGQCCDCKLITPFMAVYDFHHRVSADKEYWIGKAFSHRSLSLDDMKPELDKCELLCSNCHRIRHWEVRDN